MGRHSNLLILGIYAIFILHSNIATVHGESRAFGSSFATVTDFTPLSNLIYFEISAIKMGLGIAYNSQWVITNAKVAGDLLVHLNNGNYPVAVETSDFVIPTEKEHVVKDAVVHPDYALINHPHDDIGVVRVCPKFSITTFDVLPSTTPAYQILDTITLYGYDMTNYVKADFFINIDIYCVIDTAFTTEANFCVSISSDTYGVTSTERDMLVFALDSNGKYIGHISSINSDNIAMYGYTMFKTDFRSTWIATNTQLVQY